MCDPLTVGLVVGGSVALASGGQAIAANEGRKDARQAAKNEHRQQVAALDASFQSQTEVQSEELFELARQEAAQKGAVRASGLGENSVRALSRASGFEFGQDRATAQKNFDTTRQEYMTQAHIAYEERNAKYKAIGDTSGKQLAFDLGMATLQGAAAGFGAAAAVAPAAAPAATVSTAPTVPLSNSGLVMNAAPGASINPAYAGLMLA
tara:strand:+ start:8958 stop:9581 length:624 start_codon:yes stop_codon:yes gene_type:complete